MAHRSKIIKEWVDLKIATAGSKEKGSFEVDKHSARIIGIAISSNFDELLYHRGSQRISINEKEIYPEGYESKMLMQGLNIKVNDRIIELGEEVQIGNRKVEIEYVDNNHTLANFTPYRVRLYVYSLIND